MSIHASKGLEFPVVVVADLGRSPRGGSEYILHDPAIGLVCKVRDGNGDWQSPPSYGWGRWQVEQMEEAENKRLLYVACTHAADRLILSGKLGSGWEKGWLGQILAAWSIEPAGEEEELGTSDGLETDGPPFRVQVYRPKVQAESLGPERADMPAHSGLTHVPDLSRPLAVAESQDAVTVTRFLRDAERADGEDDELPPLRPAVRPTQADRLFHPVPRYLLGNIVHRALDDWTVLSLPSSDLHRGLFGIARSLGVGDQRSAGRRGAQSRSADRPPQRQSPIQPDPRRRPSTVRDPLHVDDQSGRAEWGNQSSVRGCEWLASDRLEERVGQCREA